jgi:hypothetical protein
LFEHEFTNELEMGAFNYYGHKDRVGRPVLFLRIEKWKPVPGDEEHLNRFFCWQIDQLSVKMPSNVD